MFLFCHIFVRTDSIFQTKAECIQTETLAPCISVPDPIIGAFGLYIQLIRGQDPFAAKYTVHIS